MTLKKRLAILMGVAIMFNTSVATFARGISALPTGGGGGISPTAELPMKEFYVSPDGSDETGDGSESSPYLTIDKARQEVRGINGNMTGDIIINVGEGVYCLEQPIAFDGQDSATNGYKIEYKAQGQDDVLISGGVDITDGWQDTGSGIFKRENVDWAFRQLYVNDSRAIRARYPNATDAQIDMSGPYDRSPNPNASYPFEIIPNAIHATAINKADSAVELTWVSSWSHFKAPVENYDVFNGKATVVFKSPTDGFAYYHHDQGSTPYFLENALEYLDAPGEWFLDKTENTLYYKPRDGETMNQTQIIAPKLETLVDIRGSEDNKVKGVQFSGMTFAHTNWLAPDEFGYCSVQAGFRYQTVGGGNNREIRNTARYESPNSMVQLRYTDSVTFSNNTFKFSGSWGIMGYESTYGTLISYNTFTQNAGGGVTMGMVGDKWDDGEFTSNAPDWCPEMAGQSIHDTIEHNTVDSVARDYMDMVGIGALLPQYMTIAHNKVVNLPYTGINFGWNWTDRDHGMTGNKAYQNYISDVCKLLQDGGGIYTLGRMDGDTNFYYNYIANIAMSEWAPHDNLMGIYFDNGSCYKKAQENVFDNTVYAFQASNPPNHSNIFESNYYNCPKGVSSIGSSTALNNRPYTSEADMPERAKEIRDNAGPGKETMPEPRPSYNAAFQKSVRVSSADDENGLTADKITDGDFTTMWSDFEGNEWNTGNGAYTMPWVEVDFEKPIEISAIIMSFQYGNRCRYKIEYSSDEGESKSWTEYVNKIAATPSSNDIIYEEKSGAVGRYIKLTIDSQGYNTGIRELVVMTTPEHQTDGTARLSVQQEEVDKTPEWFSDIALKTIANGSVLTEIKNGNYTLVPTEDYIKSWDFITLKEEYLATLPEGENTLTFKFDNSDDQTLILNVLEDDGSTNVALNKKITSNGYSLRSENMIDGDKTTRWAQPEGWDYVGRNALLTLDLKDYYDISKMSIMFELNSGYGYKIEYSVDGINRQLYADKLQGKTQTQTVHERGDILARYIYLTVLNTATTSSVYEFMVKGKFNSSEVESQQPINVAVNKRITINPSINEDDLKYILDDNQETVWKKVSGENQLSVITIDLYGYHNISGTVLTFEQSSGINYKIEHSLNDDNYITYVDKMNQQTDSSTVTAIGDAYARYVRLTVDSESHNYGIADFAIMAIKDNKNNGIISSSSYATTFLSAPPSNSGSLMKEPVYGGFDVSVVWEDYSIKNATIYARYDGKFTAEKNQATDWNDTAVYQRMPDGVYRRMSIIVEHEPDDNVLSFRTEAGGTYVLVDQLSSPLINDNDSRVRWSGFSHHGDRDFGAIKGDGHYAYDAGATFEITFEGYGIDILAEIAAGDNNIQTSFEVDGVYHSTQSLSYVGGGTRNMKQVVYSISDLPYGTHTVKGTKVTANQYLVIDAFSIQTTDLNTDKLTGKMINDTDSSITYSGGWGYSSDRKDGDYLRDVHYLYDNGSFEFDFVGEGFDIIATKDNDVSEMSIVVDGGEAIEFKPHLEPDGFRTAYNVLASVSELGMGRHHVKVNLTRVGGGYFALDAINIRGIGVDTNDERFIDYRNGIISFIPSLPVEYAQGTIYDARVGDAKVDFQWEDYSLKNVTITAYKDGSISILKNGATNWEDTVVYQHLPNGAYQRVSIISESNKSTLTFNAQENGVYVLVDDVNSYIIQTEDGRVTWEAGFHRNDDRDPFAYAGDVRYSYDTGSSFQVTFEGVGIDILAETTSGDNGQAKIDITIDDQEYPQASIIHLGDQGRGMKQVIYSVSGLTYGTHTLKGITQNNGGVVHVDAFSIQRDDLKTDKLTGEMMNNTHPSIVFTNGGWSHNTQRKDGSYHADIHFLNPGDAGELEFEFYGTGFDIIGAKKSDTPNLSIKIDDQEPVTATPSQGTMNYRGAQNILYSVSDLERKEHKVVVNVLSGASGYFEFDAINIRGGYNFVYINDNDTKIDYQGDWSYDSASGDNIRRGNYQLDRSEGRTGATAEYAFVGTNIEILSEQHGGNHPIKVSIDGEVVGDRVGAVASVGGDIGGSVMWQSPDLPYGRHVLKIEVLDGGGNGKFTLDGFIVRHKESTQPKVWSMYDLSVIGEAVVPGERNRFKFQVTQGDYVDGMKFILALYDGKRLVSVKSVGNFYSDGYKPYAMAEFDIPSDNSECVIKAFAWDRLYPAVEDGDLVLEMEV